MRPGPWQLEPAPLQPERQEQQRQAQAEPQLAERRQLAARQLPDGHQRLAPAQPLSEASPPQVRPVAVRQLQEPVREPPQSSLPDAALRPAEPQPPAERDEAAERSCAERASLHPEPEPPLRGRRASLPEVEAAPVPVLGAVKLPQGRPLGPAPVSPEPHVRLPDACSRGSPGPHRQAWKRATSRSSALTRPHAATHPPAHHGPSGYGRAPARPHPPRSNWNASSSPSRRLRSEHRESPCS